MKNKILRYLLTLIIAKTYKVLAYSQEGIPNNGVGKPWGNTEYIIHSANSVESPCDTTCTGTGTQLSDC